MLPFHAVFFAWSSWDGLLQNNARGTRGSWPAIVSARRFFEPRNIWSGRGAKHIR